MKGHRHGVTSVSFSADGKILVSGSADATALVWSLEALGIVACPEHATTVLAAAILPADEPPLTSRSFLDGVQVERGARYGESALPGYATFVERANRASHFTLPIAFRVRSSVLDRLLTQEFTASAFTLEIAGRISGADVRRIASLAATAKLD